MSFDVHQLRKEFPFFLTENGKQTRYLDNAATVQKPLAVLDAMDRFLREDNANVHRGVHSLTDRATSAYEDARNTVQKFLNAAHSDEIIFTKNCTESINLVAHSWGRKFLKRGDTVALSLLEHHSNIVPWLQLKEEIGITLEWMKPDDLRVPDTNVKLVAITGLSNVLGIQPPLKQIIDDAHKKGAVVLVDAAQLAAHDSIDVQNLDCDFLAFSGHKVYGPTGIGVLFGKRELLKNMPPFLGGGMMIGEVTEQSFTPADPPARFEAGTPPITEAIGLHTALEWLENIPLTDRKAHEATLLSRAHKILTEISGLRILGSADVEKIHSCISFTVDGVHPHDLTELLSREGFHLRAGHHCAQPLHRHLGITASTRLSVALYNTTDEIDAFKPALEKAIATLR